MSDIRESYAAHVHAVRDLGAVLSYAVEARFQPPPLGAAKGGGLVANPTLDIVLDPRRLDLSDEVRRTDAELRRATASINEKTTSLKAAVERWEGSRGETHG